MLHRGGPIDTYANRRQHPEGFKWCGGLDNACHVIVYRHVSNSNPMTWRARSLTSWACKMLGRIKWTCCGERASLNLLLQMQGRPHGCTAGAGPGIDEMYEGERQGLTLVHF
jgi:hypothetical protein